MCACIRMEFNFDAKTRWKNCNFATYSFICWTMSYPKHFTKNINRIQLSCSWKKEDKGRTREAKIRCFWCGWLEFSLSFDLSMSCRVHSTCRIDRTEIIKFRFQQYILSAFTSACRLRCITWEIEIFMSVFGQNISNKSHTNGQSVIELWLRAHTQTFSNGDRVTLNTRQKWYSRFIRPSNPTDQ